MKVTFPAMQGQIGQRTYYSCLMKLNAIPKMFTFRDWAEFTPEEREQRILNKKRVPDIAKYIVDNEDGYLFASITASYKCKVNFIPTNGNNSLGQLEMEFEDANFVINDGQHRCAAIANAIKENPALGEETISVLLFPYESRDRVQQMFSDLNRFVVKTSKSLDILYDKRDALSLVTLDVLERVSVFKNMVDKDAVSLPVRSPKLFSLSALYDANEELLKNVRVSREPSHAEMVGVAVEFWTEVAKTIPAWTKVKNGDLKALELRQESISSHAVVLRALGAIGADLLKEQPEEWRSHLMDLSTVDWSKKNRDWENVCIIANSVVSNRQARFATKAYLKRHLKMALNEAEERALSSTQPDSTVDMTKIVGLAEKMSPTEQADLLAKAKEISDKVN
jgi:DNA sulfur modification protein DndB